MDSPRLKNEGWLYGLAFLFALAFRFIELGAASLTDSEATLALQALHLAQGKSVLLAPQPLYLLFTSFFFAVTQSTNFMARFLPALFGAMIVFAPFFFHPKIGTRPALILAFLLAFDPGLVAISRQPGGTMFAVTFLLFAWGLWNNRRLIPAGICLGLALLSGPSIWSGILILLLTWIFLRFVQPKPATNPEFISEASDTPASETDDTQTNLRGVLIPLVITFLLAGTLFFTIPNGLSAAFASIPAYFTGWITPSTTTPSRGLFTFIAYELFGITLAAFSLFRGFRTNSKRIIRLSLWLGVALLLSIFDRQTSELVWAIIPLLVLAAMELSRAFDLYREELMEVGVVAIAIFILLIYIWYNVSGIALNPNPVPANVPIFGVVQNPRFFVLYGSLAILLMSVGLVAFGWSARTARLGATWACVVFFGLYSVAAAWGASGMRDPGGVELWLPDSRPLQVDLLQSSVDDLSEFSTGLTASQPVIIYNISSPALEWVLRKYEVTDVTVLDPQTAPPIVITPVMNDLGLPSAYRGQGFTWRQTPQWAAAQSSDWVTWLVFRKLPTDNETILLWARDDLFPDARKNNSQP
jgi:hypothetical protein